jgi:hypothetical protein
MDAFEKADWYCAFGKLFAREPVMLQDCVLV